MEQQRADRLRCVVTKNVRRLCGEHPSICHMEGPYRPSTAMEVVDLSSNDDSKKKETVTEEDMDDSASEYNDQQHSTLPLGNMMSGEKKLQPIKLGVKKRPVSLLSSVLYDNFECIHNNNEAEKDKVDTKQQDLLLHNTRAPVATIEVAPTQTAESAIEQIPYLSHDGIRRQSFHMESLDRCEAIFEYV